MRIHADDPTANCGAEPHAAAEEELSALRTRVAQLERARLDSGLVDLLLHQESQLRRVVAAMSEGLMIFDGKGNVVYQNRASLRLHGFDDDERGEIEREALPRMWEAWDASGRALGVEEWPASRVLRGESVHDQVVHTWRRDTGKDFWASYNGSPITMPTGGCLCVSSPSGTSRPRYAPPRPCESAMSDLANSSVPR